MLKYGASPEEIELRGKMASSFLPEAPVDREIPPEEIEPMREHLEQLYAACQADPVGYMDWFERHTAKMAQKN